MADKRKAPSPPADGPPTPARPRSPRSPPHQPPQHPENHMDRPSLRGNRTSHIQHVQDLHSSALTLAIEKATEARRTAAMAYNNLPYPVPCHNTLLRRQRQEEHQAGLVQPSQVQTVPPMAQTAPTLTFSHNLPQAIQQRIRSIMHEETREREMPTLEAEGDMQNRDQQQEHTVQPQIVMPTTPALPIAQSSGRRTGVEDCPQCNEDIRVNTVTVHRPTIHQHQVLLTEVTTAIWEAKQLAERCTVACAAIETLLFPELPSQNRNSPARQEVPPLGPWQLTAQQTESLLEHTLRLSGTEQLYDRRFLQANPPYLPPQEFQKTLLKGQSFGLIQQPPIRCCACKNMQTVMMETNITHDMFRCLDCSTRTVAYR